MIDICDKNHQPDLREIAEYISNPLFDELYRYMTDICKAICEVEYSGDNILLGWNIRFVKSGRTLCRAYPRAGYFHILTVIGSKEKTRVEKIIPSLSDEFRSVYNSTKEGMGQRWLIFNITDSSVLLDDIKEIVRIRRENA